MTTKSKPTHVFEHDGVDYVLTEVFGSAVMHNEEEDTYCIDKEQMGKMIEHIRQQMGIAGFFQTRAEGLNKKLNDMRQAIRELESPKVAEEVGDYRDEIRRDKVYDKFLEYYRLHGDEINKLSMERLVPVYTAKRFGESSDCKVVQECLDAYEERIDELTKQCDEVQAELTDINNKATYKNNLRLDEIDLLNVLRGYGESAIFIRKNKSNDAWKAEYLTARK